jgi:hypothetical protein
LKGAKDRFFLRLKELELKKPKKRAKARKIVEIYTGKMPVFLPKWFIFGLFLGG